MQSDRYFQLGRKRFHARGQLSALYQLDGEQQVKALAGYRDAAHEAHRRESDLRRGSDERAYLKAIEGAAVEKQEPPVWMHVLRAVALFLSAVIVLAGLFGLGLLVAAMLEWLGLRF